MQELIRFNRLIRVVRSSLQNLLKALKGLVLMSAELEMLRGDVAAGRLPSLWASRSYPSLKPLAAYFKDLLQRLATLQVIWSFIHPRKPQASPEPQHEPTLTPRDNMQAWIDGGSKPNAFWLPGFYFTHAFLTGALQNYARKHKTPIDQIVFDFVMLPGRPDLAVEPPPPDGVHTYGLHVEGARWDEGSQQLEESRPKVND